MKLTGVLFIFTFLPYFVTPNDGFVYEYNSDNFRKQIDKLDGNFVMFYAPWCKHCTDFHPIWQELAEIINTEKSKFGIAQVDCTLHVNLCNEYDITGYPILLYFHKGSFQPIEYKGTRDMPSLTLFLSEVFAVKLENPQSKKNKDDVVIYGGLAHLTDHNVEKFLSKGQHFVMFYASWCKASQKLAPVWAELAINYSHSEYVQIGKINCEENPITCENFDIKQYPYLLWIVNGRIMGVSAAGVLEELKSFVELMVLAENHDPDKFMKKKKVLPVARITEETFETFLDKDLVFINYFAPWCAHCMQLSPLWMQLGETFQNESRVLIADVDCARSKPICQLEKIVSLPTLVLYKNKEIVEVEKGGKPLETLVSVVNKHLQDINTSEKAPGVQNEQASQEANENTPPTKDEL